MSCFQQDHHLQLQKVCYLRLYVLMWGRIGDLSQENVAFSGWMFYLWDYLLSGDVTFSDDVAFSEDVVFSGDVVFNGDILFSGDVAGNDIL